jgi:hypothetical protein
MLLRPDQEYRQTTTYKALTGKDIESWYLRNIDQAKVQCFPDYVTDIEIRDKKLRNAANTETDEQYCSQISSPEIQKACYSDLYFKYIKQAIGTNDSQLCETIDPARGTHDIRSRCYEELAEATKNWSLCKFIPDTERNFKNLCYMKTSTVETCFANNNLHEKDWCYNSLKQCELIIQKEMSDSCFYSNIKEVWQRIGTKESIKMCKALGSLPAIPAEYSRKRCLEILKEAAKNDPNAYLDFQE